ncbi:YdeI/OmpD-associated family protein [Streptomyces sp. S.PB5]|uniref:YdeI/OmpD-associated family protein n=1 Tax=Streptomyces sp. S.PB5 TaxID=3020844 RepID=UPI0025B08668|nr:YdeI/OmpD-associated family protein [Streptomyces sp. S.PB5]MDN3025079.1 YdeI/OmpD-associated family protein [Streptomyces sp. S.PB5]
MTSPEPSPPHPRPLPFESVAHLDAWLADHPAPHPGLWVKVAKKGSGIPSVTWEEVNDVALCHGWITGQRKALDDAYFLQRITPRRRGSLWSMVNVRRVAELIEEGRMREAGLVEVEAARADGRWTAAYPSQKEAAVPEGLATALEDSPRARAAFEALGKSARYQVMLGVLQALTPESRAAQVAAAVAKLESA